MKRATIRLLHSTFQMAVATFVGTLLFAASAGAGEKVYVGQKRPARMVSIDAINHASFDNLLRRYVDDAGNVNYAAWKAHAGDRRLFDTYLAHLSTANPKAEATREARLAFWINTYNAVTIQGILREYPTTSIRNHTAKLFGYNIWHDLLLSVGGRPYSLDQIEHQVLRKMGEPRIHFAIVCASVSCPKLRNEAYRTKTLDAQLTDNTKDFFATAANFRYDARRGNMQLSSILKWFAADFGSDQQAQLKTIAPYFPTADARAAAREGSASVTYLDYNWNLNDQQGSR